MEKVLLLLVALLLLKPQFEKFYLERIKPWRRIRSLKKKAVDTIHWAICQYDHKALFKAMEKESPTWCEEKAFVREKILNNVSYYKSFFNQVLKSRACNLQAHIDKSAGMRELKFDSLNRAQIETYLQEEETAEENMRFCERSFWDLHDTLKALGMRTWGDKGHSIYLMLEPIKEEDLVL